jgi:hypothetical protein
MAAISASAIDFENLVMPGPVIEGHADVESECARCHSPFEREAESRLCLECHKEVASDLEDRAGFHGRALRDADESCRECHDEHRGRGADIVGLAPETFNHSLTDHPLLGAHLRIACGECHLADRKYREAKESCVACHHDADPHGGEFTRGCGECHDEESWSSARFNHGQTAFPLEGEHGRVDCAVCHPSTRYKGTRKDCMDCHATDDVHRGGFGSRCASCHDTTSWKKGSFDHDAKTDFPLRGQHLGRDCTSCHEASKPGKKEALDSRCVGCHRADDEHRGSYGDDCSACHDAGTWRDVRFDHDRRTHFELTGTHADVACRSCHRGPLHREKLATDCSSCHVDDDVHRGEQGDACEACHDTRSWVGHVTFDHELARFPLLGLHALVSCEECHMSREFREAPESCDACHASQDVHEGRLGSRCSECHNPNGWQLWRFDHGRRTRLALQGGHQGLACQSCHTDAKKSRMTLSRRCESCHAMEDPHRGSFGTRCGNCHQVEGWGDLRIGHRATDGR